MLTVFFSCLIVSSVSSSSQEVGRGTRGTAPPPFDFNLDLQGHYNLTQGHKLWLAGAPVFVHTDGHNYTTDNGSLTLVHTQHHQGRDKVGQWVSTCFLYLAGSRHFQTCAKSWTNPQLPVVIFQQVRLLYRETSSVEFNSFFKRTKVEILNSLLRKKKKKNRNYLLSARGLSTEQRNRQQEVWRRLFPVSRHSKFHRTIRVWPTSVTRAECLEVTPGQAGKSKQTDWRYISVTGGIFLRARVEMRYFFLIFFLFILIFHAV